MSAKISIESEDPALAAVLAMLFAKAIQDAGFTKAKAKTVMIEQPAARVVGDFMKFNRVNEACEHLGSEACYVKENRLPPVLKDIRMTCPPGDTDWLKDVVERNPGILDKPIVLSHSDDNELEYNLREQLFLLTGEHRE